MKDKDIWLVWVEEETPQEQYVPEQDGSIIGYLILTLMVLFVVWIAVLAFGGVQ